MFFFFFRTTPHRTYFEITIIIFPQPNTVYMAWIRKNSSVLKPMPRPNNASKAEDRAPCPGHEQTPHAHAANVPTASQTQAVSSCAEAISSPATVRRRLSSLYHFTMKGMLQQTYHVQYCQSCLDDRSPQRKSKLTTKTIYHLQCGKHQVARASAVVIFIIRILP